MGVVCRYLRPGNLDHRVFSGLKHLQQCAAFLHRFLRDANRRGLCRRRQVRFGSRYARDLFRCGLFRQCVFRRRNRLGFRCWRGCRRRRFRAGFERRDLNHFRGLLDGAGFERQSLNAGWLRRRGDYHRRGRFHHCRCWGMRWGRRRRQLRRCRWFRQIPWLLLRCLCCLIADQCRDVEFTAFQVAVKFLKEIGGNGTGDDLVRQQGVAPGFHIREFVE